MELTIPIIRRIGSMLRKLKKKMEATTRRNDRQNRGQEIFEYREVLKGFAWKCEEDKTVRSHGIETDYPKNKNARSCYVHPSCYQSYHVRLSHERASNTQSSSTLLEVHAHQHNAYPCLDPGMTFRKPSASHVLSSLISPRANTCNSIPGNT